MIVSAFTFISPVSSSMIAPASRQLAERFDIHSTVLLAMTVSVFVLAYGGNFHSPAHSLRSLHVFAAIIIALGPLFLGPLSEVYGRSHVLQLANLWFLGICFRLSPE
jgi:MFS family permease